MKYRNPVIPGFHTDPSVCRAEKRAALLRRRAADLVVESPPLFLPEENLLHLIIRANRLHYEFFAGAGEEPYLIFSAKTGQNWQNRSKGGVAKRKHLLSLFCETTFCSGSGRIFMLLAADPFYRPHGETCSIPNTRPSRFPPAGSSRPAAPFAIKAARPYNLAPEK